MRDFYRKLRKLGLNALRAFIAAKMLSRTEWSLGDVGLDAVAEGMAKWTDHQCHVYVQNGYQWPEL